MIESTDRNEDANVTADVTADETDPEPTADQRRAELPGLGYTGKFDHGDDDTADDELELGEGEDEVPPAPAVQTSPPPAAQPWTLGRGGE
jgi:hypothetical protein